MTPFVDSLLRSIDGNVVKWSLCEDSDPLGDGGSEFAELGFEFQDCELGEKDSTVTSHDESEEVEFVRNPTPAGRRFFNECSID